MPAHIPLNLVIITKKDWSDWSIEPSLSRPAQVEQAPARQERANQAQLPQLRLKYRYRPQLQSFLFNPSASLINVTL